MRLFLAALDYHTAAVEVRERFAFSGREVREALHRLRKQEAVTGVALLCTCNRTELYLTAEGEISLSAARLLCMEAGIDWEGAAGCFLELCGEDAVRHLMEVACGLQSMILCEDQIITQVKNAAQLAREEKTASPALETLFRMAATAAKKAKTEVIVKAVPRSSAERAAELLADRLGGLEGRSVLVIGNGEMGRLCAGLLAGAGCETTVTLRTYRHGETVVPFGCKTIPYDQRTDLLTHCDAVVSATVSPHYTLTAEMMRGLPHKPRFLVDLAVPRDIDPQLDKDPDFCCLNIDDMVTAAEQQALNAEAVAQIHGIIAEQMELYRQWLAIHEGSDSIARIKEALMKKVRFALALEDLEREDLLEAAVSKTVDAMLFSAREELSYELIQAIDQNLAARLQGIR